MCNKKELYFFSFFQQDQEREFGGFSMDEIVYFNH